MTYTGIVIGGPNAARVLSSDRDTLEITKAPSLKAFDPEGKFDPYETFKVYVYKHVPFGIRENGDDTIWGFWVDIDEKNPMHRVMNALVRNYQANARPKR